MDIEKIKKRGELRKLYPRIQTVRDEMRRNLVTRIERG